MFSDPFTAVMALILLAFIGTLVVFLRIWRELDSLRASINEIKDNLRFYAVDSSQQGRDIFAALREIRTRADAPPQPEDPAGEACLSELLEKGLPNILGEPQELSERCATAASSSSAHEGDEDLIRRLGDGLGREAGQK